LLYSFGGEGIRLNADFASTAGLTYPMISMKPTTQPEVRHWWNDHGFDLEGVGEHETNCQVCFKKTDRKLYTIGLNHPERFEFTERMERENGFCGAEPSLHRPFLKEWQEVVDKNGDKQLKEVAIAYEIKRTPRVFFRGYRKTQDIIASSKEPFIQFQDYLPELQLTLDIDPLDRGGDCNDGCEI